MYLETLLETSCSAALHICIKGQYGKYYALYDDKLRSSLLHDQAIADSMEDALSGDQFQIYLQPKYRIIDGALAGAEALVRWEHPEWGVQSPANFIPICLGEDMQSASGMGRQGLSTDSGICKCFKGRYF